MLLSLSLAVLIIAVYWSALRNGFVNYDDDIYVYLNPHIKNGLSLSGLKWAFTSVSYVYWQPLTWISHMVDVQFFGLSPAGHHLTNVILHTLSSVLLLVVLFRMTGRLWCAAAVAALFALHPLRVESVAWIAERKDVLSTFFFACTLGAYAWYVNRPSIRRYAAVTGALGLGLMSKPMLVSAPLLLLLIDYWPLRRTGSRAVLIREKLPLLGLTAVISFLTFTGQTQMGATRAIENVTPVERLANAIVSYVRYLGKMVWPHPLAILYPYDHHLPGIEVAGSLVLLVAITALVFRNRGKRPYLLFGWLWFLIALLPTIGLVQVGPQAYADRFSYIPSLGIVIAVVWSIAEVTGNERDAHAVIGTRWAAAALFTAIVTLAVITRIQIGYWRDGITAFQHAAETTPANALTEHNLGFALLDRRREADALPHLRMAVQLEPKYFQGHYNLGKALANTGAMEPAIESFTEAIRYKPDYAEAYYARAVTEQKAGQGQAAESDFELALHYGLDSPYRAEALNSLGVIDAQRGDLKGATSRFESAVATEPDLVAAQMNLAAALAQLGQTQQAIERLNSALAETHGDAQIRAMLDQLRQPASLR